MNYLLFTTAFIAFATYLGTQQDSNSLNYRDQILKMRKDIQETAAREAEEDSRREFTGRYRGGTYNYKGRNTFWDRRSNTREKYVRRLLENMFRYRFPSVKPKWLVNPKTGRRLEIDCYCRELRLGVEIDGEQHHRYIPHFHKKGYREFQEQKERDMMKAAMTKKHGTRLVRLPYTVQEADIEAYLLEKINKLL